MENKLTKKEKINAALFFSSVLIVLILFIYAVLNADKFR